MPLGCEAGQHCKLKSISFDINRAAEAPHNRERDRERDKEPARVREELKEKDIEGGRERKRNSER